MLYVSVVVNDVLCIEYFRAAQIKILVGLILYQVYRRYALLTEISATLLNRDGQKQACCTSV